MMLQIFDICKQYKTGNFIQKALDHVSLNLRDNEFVAILGPSGSGKTTLLKLISGEVEMANPDSDEECGIVMAGKQRIGYLRQISFEDSSITVEEEILKVFAPVFSCEKRMQELTEQMKTDTSEHLLKEYATLQAKMEALRGYTYRQDMETMFQRFGFALKDLQRPIGTFSGGQQTKVAFVKLLLSQPDIMLLDEPFSALDYQTRLNVSDDIGQIIKKEKKTAILVTHDLAEAISLADRILVLTSRPATIGQTVNVSFSDPGLSPLARRNAPEFKTYFNLIWKELNPDE